MARLFLSRFEGPGSALELSQVDAEAVTAFVVAERHRRSIASAQVSVTALRSLLRFLFLEGYISQRLGDAVPAVSVPKGFLPRGLADEVVEALLGSCDISTNTGKRDLAVLNFILEQTRSERDESAKEKGKLQKGQAYADAIAEQRRLTGDS